MIFSIHFLQTLNARRFCNSCQSTLGLSSMQPYSTMMIMFVWFHHHCTPVYQSIFYSVLFYLFLYFNFCTICVLGLVSLFSSCDSFVNFVWALLEGAWEQQLLNKRLLYCNCCLLLYRHYINKSPPARATGLYCHIHQSHTSYIPLILFFNPDLSFIKHAHPLRLLQNLTRVRGIGIHDWFKSSILHTKRVHYLWIMG